MPRYSVMTPSGKTVSFDYDGTLDEAGQQEAARYYLDNQPPEPETQGDIAAGLGTNLDATPDLLSIGSTATLSYVFAGIVGYGLYKLITVKGTASTARDYGRIWMAWMVFITTLTPPTLPSFFQHFDVDSFIKWIMGVVFFGAVAFVLGWAYGKFFGNKQEQNNDKVMAQLAKPKKSPVSVGLKWTFFAVIIGIWASILTFYYRNLSIPAAILNGVVFTLISGAIAFFAGWIFAKLFGKKDDTQKPTNTHPAPSSTQEPTVSQNIELTSTTPAPSISEEELWAQALSEFEGDSRRSGLWAKSFADARGDEAVAKATYLRQRVSELLQEQEKLEDIINAYDENGYTQLMNAAREGNLHLVKKLISQGANPKLVEKQFGLATALSMANTTLNGIKDQQTRYTYQSIIDILKPLTPQ